MFLLLYAYVPNTTITIIKAKMTALADENSFIVGVGEAVVLVGLKTG